MSHSPRTYSAFKDSIATADEMLEHSLKCWIGMYHVLPDHFSARPFSNLDKNLNQYNALACNRDSGWDFQGSDMWNIL